MIENQRSIVRVGTFNLKVGVDSSPTALASSLVQLSLELCALQELGQHWSLGVSIDQCRLLASAQHHSQMCFYPLLERCWSLDPYRGGPFTYQSVSQAVDSPRGYYGIGLTASGIIGAVHTRPLPQRVDEPRGFIHCQWLPEGSPLGPVHILNTHLSVNLEERLSQARELRAYIDSLEGPLMLIGDLNDIPSSETLAIFMDRDGLIDIAADYNADRYTFSVREPHRRIDYILARDVQAVAYGVATWITTSDHFPIWAEVTW